MKDKFTTLEAFTTSDGKTIIFRESCVIKFFKTIFEQNYLQLSAQEKEEVYLVNQRYGDLLDRAWREPLQKALEPTGAKWALPDTKRNPMEEYKHALSVAKDADITEEAHQAKLERLRLHAELFAKKIK